MVAKKKVVKKTAKKAPANKKAAVKKKAPAKKVVAKKKAPAKKATTKKVEPKKKSSVKKVVAKKKAPAKKVEAKKKVVTKKTEPNKKVPTKKAPSEGSVGSANKKVTKQVIEVIKPIAQNEFINLKMAKSHHENPREHAHEEPKAQEEIDHAPLTPFVREEAKVGRNDPCPCGSGLKFKKCCGKIS